MMKVVSVDLPLPPSVNAAFAARRGSHLLMKTAAYTQWVSTVREEYSGRQLQAAGGGKYGLFLILPRCMRGDIDNRVKLVSDILSGPPGESVAGRFSLGVVADDADMEFLYVGRSYWVDDGRCTAVVVPTERWKTALCELIDMW